MFHSAPAAGWRRRDLRRRGPQGHLSLPQVVDGLAQDARRFLWRVEVFMQTPPRYVPRYFFFSMSVSLTTSAP
jgi:hypothetical protein